MAHLKKSYKEQDITKDELACIYSALILADDDIPITQEKIQTLLRAANVEVEPLWPSLFARALSDCNIKSMLQNIAGAALAGGGGVAGGASGAAGAEEKVEEKKEETKAEPEPEDDSDEDFGLSLFD